MEADAFRQPTGLERSGLAPPAQPDWLSGWQTRPFKTDAAVALFDRLPAVEPEAMVGLWRGSGLHSGHPLDGVLESLGWYGKAFHDVENVDPLLFQSSTGRLLRINPAFAPIGPALRWRGFATTRFARTLFAGSRRVWETGSPAARLRPVRWRGVTSTAMIYDRQPIIDYFRAIDPDRVLGLMDLREAPQPFFFLLTREPPGALARFQAATH